MGADDQFEASDQSRVAEANIIRSAGRIKHTANGRPPREQVGKNALTHQQMADALNPQFRAHRHLGTSRSSGAWLCKSQASQSNEIRGEGTTWKAAPIVAATEAAQQGLEAAPIAVASLSVSAAFQAHRHLGASRNSGAWLSKSQDSQSNDFGGERTARMTAAMNVLRSTVKSL